MLIENMKQMYRLFFSHLLLPHLYRASCYYQRFLLPTDAQENCFKRSIKIYIKTAATCFGVITIIRERTVWTC